MLSSREDAKSVYGALHGLQTLNSIPELQIDISQFYAMLDLFFAMANMTVKSNMRDPADTQSAMPVQLYNQKGYSPDGSMDHNGSAQVLLQGTSNCYLHKNIGACLHT
eukprot:Gb_31943 [translate_table: standard]